MRAKMMAAGAALLTSLTIPASAGPAEMNLLSSYIGSWSGVGVLQGSDQRPESFRCRMIIAPGAGTRINYSGRCTLISMNLSVAGTIAFNDATRRYQATMSSNAGFTGYAVGYRRANRIDFDLQRRQLDQRGNDMTIGSRIHLAGGTIGVDFRVEFNNSGKVLTAVVPFTR